MQILCVNNFKDEKYISLKKQFKYKLAISEIEENYYDTIECFRIIVIINYGSYNEKGYT